MSNLGSGDLAIIIKSVMGATVGKIVQCIKIAGIDPMHGRVWFVRSKEVLVSEYGATGYTVHVPEAWLRKIEPGELDKKDETQKPKETTK